MKEKVEYLSNLTPLRGVAAILVAVFHFEMAVCRFVPAAQTNFFEKCYIMVDLFFVMSGFIIMHVYGNTFKDSLQKTSLRRFFVARFARIYPLHLAVMLLLLALVFLIIPKWSNPPVIFEQHSDILPSIFLLHSFGLTKIYCWNIPSWSISAECAAYVLFPLLAIFSNKKKIISVVIFLLFIVIAYYCIMFVLPRKNPLYPTVPVPHNLNTTFDYGYLRGIAGFMLGILIYRLYKIDVCKKIFSNDISLLINIALIILVMHNAWNDALVVALFALLVLHFACNNGIVHKVCNLRPAQFIGDISYSIYLMQIFFQEPFSHGIRLPGVTGFGRGKMNIDFGHGLVYCIINIALLISVSTLSYRFIEVPCRKYINRRWGK
ncbi:MAG: acyltransferase [Chitinophagaceae bacterium]|jgi:peptidoglycan/LPS O-acetylase OafA/YrhL|nr:acyltransferase [Chitinophagaceae bacterium]